MLIASNQHVWPRARQGQHQPWSTNPTPSSTQLYGLLKLKNGFTMLFKRPEIINKLYKVLKEYSVKFSSLLVNIQTLSVASQAFSLQPLSKPPNLLFDPLKKFPPPQTLFRSSLNFINYPQFFLFHSVASSGSYSPSHPNTLFLRQNPCWGAVFTCTIAVKL